MSGRCAPRSRCFWWECQYVAQAAIEPGAQRASCAKSTRRNVDHASTRAPCEIHWARVRLGNHSLEIVGSHPHHQIGPDYAAAHVSSYEECEPTKHLSLDDVGPRSHSLPDSTGERFVERHLRRSSYLEVASAQTQSGRTRPRIRTVP